MKRLVLVACGLVLVAGLSGCGSSADSLMKDEIKLMNELADAMESGAPQSKIDEISKKLNENGEKLKALKLSDADGKKLAEKYKDDLAKVSTRLRDAMLKGLGKQLGDLKMPDHKMPDIGGTGGTGGDRKVGGQDESKK